MKKILCAFLMIGMSSAIAPAFAQSSAASSSTTTKKPVKKAVKKAAVVAAPAAAAVADDDNQEDLGEANIEGSAVTNFSCELGNKVTIYTNDNDDKHIAIRWKDKVHRLGRIGTSTGANRFENRKAGLVWINIPSKAMLLDSKKGQQLANECRNPEQAKAQAAKG
ncbi:hypothetical protein [Herminiimonas arsenitoxidans]|uniref:hypothetical protein n=1 Tax=Herminiimonas arsenitoxidans TaxID=1809410 RepID=UPI0009710760|nr:hypothetical protein [Herminiimonas arsenitoxidans]